MEAALCEGPQSTAGLCHTLHQFPSVLWSQALFRSGAEKGAVPSGGRGDGREDRHGSGRFQTSISCAAQFSLQNRRAEQRVTLSKLSWCLALASLQTYGVSCPRRRALSPGFRDSCM